MNSERLQIDHCKDITGKFIEKVNEAGLSKAQVLGSLSGLGEEFYYHLNLSVLSGEYVLSTSFESNIDAILDLLKQEYSNLSVELPFDPSNDDEASSDRIEFSRFEIFSDLFFTLKESLSDYKTFVHYIWSKIQSPDKQYLLNHIDPDDSEVTQNDALNLKRYSELFYYNVFLSNVDFLLTLNYESLKKLFFVLNKIEKRTDRNETIPLLLSEKCKLLIIKFKLKYDSTNEFKSLLISFDFNEKDLTHTPLSLPIYLNFEIIYFLFILQIQMLNA